MKINNKLRAAGFLMLTTLVIITSARAEDIIETIGGINTLLYGIAAGVAALMITFHAIKWKTAAGPNDREEAKRGIINVILGLILIMIAASLVGLLFSKGPSVKPVCGNLKCESGETSTNCASDCCPDGSSKSTNPTCAPPVSCNKNKNCEPWAGETNAICANDCCPDGSSTSANPGCTNPPTACNKNSACEPPTENSINCPTDCCPDLTSRNTNPTCKPPCNNDLNCGAGENSGNCPNDCCPDGSSKSVNPTCGGSTPSTTTAVSTSTTTTDGSTLLTAKNLVNCIKNANGAVWRSTTCPWCDAQQALFDKETAAPVGPGASEYQRLSIHVDQGYPSGCGGYPSWSKNGACFMTGCNDMPSLNNKFCSPKLTPVPGHHYFTCAEVY